MLLKGIVQKTLQGNPTVVARLKGRTAASVCEEMEELEKTVVDYIGKLKARVTEGETVVASECEQSEQVIESLRANVAALETKLKEKDAASQRTEQTFTVKIVDLLGEIKKKDEVLDNNTNEIKDLKSKLDGQASQLTQVEQALTESKAETASYAKRAEQIAANAKAMIKTLESQLKEARDIAREKDSTITALESQLAKIQDLENQIGTQEEELANRNREISDLRSEVTTLMKGIKEMSSFFRQAEALANVHSEHTLTDVHAAIFDSGKQVKTETKPASVETIAAFAVPFNGTDTQTNAGKEKQAVSQPPPLTTSAKLMSFQSASTVDAGKQAQAKPTGSQPASLTLTSNTRDASREEIVSAEFFDSMTRELSEAFGPMAPLILRDHVKAVGESMEKFPKARVAELLDNVSKEIANETIKNSFRQHLDRLHLLDKTAA